MEPVIALHVGRSPRGSATATAILRPIGLLLGLLLFLILIYEPSRRFLLCIGDVELYKQYGCGLLAHPMRLPQEYPPLSAGIFALPLILLPGHYMLGFALLALLAAWVTLLVVDRLSGAGCWLASCLVLAGTGTLFWRYDIFVAMVTVLAFAAAARRHWLGAQALLALGVALKLYPVVLLPLVILWEWRETRRLPLRSGLGGALLLLVVVGGMVVLTPQQAAGVARYQMQRPFEFGAVGVSLAYLFGPLRTDSSFGSINLVSPYSPVLLPMMAGLHVVLLLALYAAFSRGRFAPATGWALALLITLITNKVFSPQYLLWILPFVVLARSDGAATPSRHAWNPWLWAPICGLTTLIYPLTLQPYIMPAMAAGHVAGWWLPLLGLRNALLVVVGILAVCRWSRPGSGRRSHACPPPRTFNSS